MQKGKYDLFIIGAGPGGYTAAILAAKKGLKVGVAEAGRSGGTCTNLGCIPTKSYIESVKLFTGIGNASRFGIEAEIKPFNLEKVYNRKERIVSRLSKGIEFLLKTNGVELIKGAAIISGHNEAKVDNEILNFDNLIISTGARPKPCAFDVPGIWTSNEALSVKMIPQSLLIVGGGVIGMEMAVIFSSLGTKVTVVEAMERILPGEEPDASQLLVKTMRTVRFMSSSLIKEIKTGEGFKTSILSGGKIEEIVTEKILWCTGRAPVVPEGIESLRIERHASGGIKVDKGMRTSVPGIFAIGDVTGEWMLAYIASREAEVAVDNITGGNALMDYSCVPSIVFTSPEIASVGIMHHDASGLKKGTFPVSGLGRARTAEESDGFANVYTDKRGRLVRVTIAAPHATELIAWASLAVSKGMTIREFLEPVYTHPTFSELIKEAAEDGLGMSVHKG
jgi:dihydrolipoamide dehydrogenase